MNCSTVCSRSSNRPAGLMVDEGLKKDETRHLLSVLSANLSNTESVSSSLLLLAGLMLSTAHTDSPTRITVASVWCGCGCVVWVVVQVKLQ